MTSPGQPLIIFIPGLLPKPEREVHRDALLRCLLAGVRRIDTEVAAAIELQPAAFDIVSWTFDFYRARHEFEDDRAAVDAVIEKAEADERDIAEATSWKRRLTRWVYKLGDRVPFLIPHIAGEKMEVHLRDLNRYLRDANGIAAHTRRMLKAPLLAAAEGGHPVLLIAHSMGSVIAYDSLWELSRGDYADMRLDMLLTLGSPLGQHYMQQRLKGAAETGVDRYPANIRQWRNLSAVGDLTALDPILADDFADMLELGLVESLEDELLLTHFRLHGRLNVHSEYGYLANEKTARTIVQWWRGHDLSLRR